MYLEKALALDKNHKDSSEELKACLLELIDIFYTAKPEKTVQFYNQLIQISENPEEHYGNIAGLYKKLGDYEQALTYYTKAILAGDGCGAYQGYILKICKNLNDKDGQQILEQTLEEKPNADTHFVLYRAYFEKENYAKALEHILKYMDLYKLTNFIAIGKKFFKKKLYKDALTIFEKVNNEETNYWTRFKALINIGLCYLDMKPINIDKALAAFQEAYKMDNSEKVAHQNINICGAKYLDVKAYDKAISTFQFCIDNNLVQDMAYFNIGVSYKLQQEYKKALPYYEEALKLKPDNEKYQRAVNFAKKQINSDDKGLLSKLFWKKK